MSSMHVVAAGAITPLGHDVERTVASLRSGLDHFKRIPFLGSSGADLVVSPIEGYADGTTSLDRYEALAIKAILPCLNGLPEDDRSRLAIFLGLPRPRRPGVPTALGRVLSHRIANRLGLPLQAFHVIELGRVSALVALAQARHALGSGVATQCIVGGVDVLVNAGSLRGLSEAGQLKEEWDGFIPGEAAAFVRIMTVPVPGHWGVSPAAIRGIGLARDAATGTASDPLVGVGICAALRAAVRDAGTDESAVHFYINDLNGSRSGYEDFAMGHIRFSRSPKEDLELWHLASYLGETGAAVGALELIWACAALELGLAPAADVMLAASEDEHRVAVLVSAAPHAALPSPCRAVGRGTPAMHTDVPLSAVTPARDLRALRLDGEDLHHDLLEQNFRELSWLCSLRAQHHDKSNSPWADIESFERRLIAHLDAVAWSGTEGRHLASDLVRSEDLGEVSAATMVLLSFPDVPSGPDQVFEAMLERPECVATIASVLPHMPGKSADPLIHRMVFSGDPALVAAGVRSLAIAGRMDREAARPALLSRDLGVVVELVHALGSAGLNVLWLPVQAVVQGIPGTALSGVNLVAYLNLAPPGELDMDAMRSRLVRDMPIAAALLCLRESSSFVDLVGAKADWNAATLDAAGWSGESAAVPVLLAALESADTSAQDAAAAALHRISGISCKAPMWPEPSERGSAGVSNVGVALSHDAAEWRHALRHFVSRTAGAARWRHGQPWSARSALDHLRRTDPTFKERLIANWEFALVKRAALPCYPSLYVARQRELLSALAGP